MQLRVQRSRLGPHQELRAARSRPCCRTRIKAAVAAQRCEACGTRPADLPKSTDGTNTQAQCSAAGTCVDPGNANACVPRFLGVEGRLDLGGFLSSFGAPDAKANLSLAAGSSVTVNQGLSFGTRVGIQAGRPGCRRGCRTRAPTRRPLPAASDKVRIGGRH